MNMKKTDWFDILATDQEGGYKQAHDCQLHTSNC